MIEDVINEVLPVIGFAAISSSIFVILVMRKGEETFRFLLYFAISDLIEGIATIYAGLYGVFMNVHGDSSGKEISPLNCYFGAFHNLVWSFVDLLQLILLFLFSMDRFLRMIIPVRYKKVSSIYLLWKVFVCIIILSIVATVPSTDFAIMSNTNTSIVVSSLCRYKEVVGEDYYSQHLLSIQTIPICALFALFLSLLIKGIRETRPKWSYNWSEERKDSKQLFHACLMRCIFTAISVHLPIMLLSQKISNSSIMDYVIRIFHNILVPILQPLFYISFLPIFNTRIQMVFNQYSHNTKRDWISASDPPAPPGQSRDKFGDANPFGSWYSSAGNVVGEAGLPIETQLERSVSFYYEKEEKEELEKQKKNQKPPQAELASSVSTAPSVPLDF